MSYDDYGDYVPKRYIVHPNVSDVGGFNIGTITLKYRNAIEAGAVLVLMVLFWKFLIGFFSWKIKAVFVIIDFFLQLFFLVGIGSDSVGQYLIKIIEFRQNASYIRYRIPRKDPEKKEKRKGRKRDEDEES